jgi:adenylate kinase
MIKLSTGDMLRAAIAAETEVGKVAETLMKNGELVPDKIVIDIIKERINQSDCASGFILDGFPRTINQVQALDKMLSSNNLIVDKVICLEVDAEIIVTRQAGRRIASKSGCVYHIEHNPPKVPGKCDVSGEDLIQRDDDKEDVVRHRLDVYEKTFRPILDYYENLNMLDKVKGDLPLKEVTTEILSIVEQK